MTVTDTGRQAVDELLPRARDLAAREGSVPSRNALMKALRIGQPKAAQIHDLLRTERAERRERRRRELRAVRFRKTPAHGLRPRSGPVPAAPVAPLGRPVTPEPFAQVVTRPEGGAASTASPLPETVPRPRRTVPRWPLLLLALPAFVAIWSGWVGLGELTGFGVMHPLPGIADQVAVDTAITLPVGLETYAAYALFVWLSGAVPARARRFAKWSAIGSLVLGAAGQVAYHLMAAAGMTAAPWWITTGVSCLPVAVVGMGAALYHLVQSDNDKR